MASKKAMPKTFDGKSTKPGGGGRFAMLQAKLEKEGKSPQSAGNIAAAIGRKNEGKAKFQRQAAAGRKRAVAKKKAAKPAPKIPSGLTKLRNALIKK